MLVENGLWHAGDAAQYGIVHGTNADAQHRTVAVKIETVIGRMLIGQSWWR